jgi:hypothetical protein
MHTRMYVCAYTYIYIYIYTHTLSFLLDVDRQEQVNHHEMASRKPARDVDASLAHPHPHLIQSLHSWQAAARNGGWCASSSGACSRA